APARRLRLEAVLPPIPADPAQGTDAIHSAGRLIHGFDDVAPHCLDRLLTLRRKGDPSLRSVKCLRPLQAVPLSARHNLGSPRPFQWKQLSTSSVERATTGGTLRSPNKGGIESLGRSIDGFDLIDGVGLRLCLSLKALNSRPTECGSCNQ